MKRRVCCFAGVLALATPQYSCHKPTPQEDYAHSKHCYAVLDVLLKTVPAAGFKRARLDRGAVQAASDDLLAAAWDSGKSIGISINAISADVERERASYLQAHTGGESKALGDDSQQCLDDYFGTPYD